MDKLILSIIVSNKGSSLSKICETIKTKYSRVIPDGQIKSSIQRLSKDDFVKESSDSFLPTKKAIIYLEGNLDKIESATKALITDIVDKVRTLYQAEIEKTQLTKSNQISKTL